MDVVIWTFPNSPLRNITRELNHNHNSDQNRRCYSFQSVNKSLKLPKKNWGGVSVSSGHKANDVLRKLFSRFIRKTREYRLQKDSKKKKIAGIGVCKGDK